MSPYFDIGEIKVLAQDKSYISLSLRDKTALKLNKGIIYIRVDGIMVPFSFTGAKQTEDRLLLKGDFSKFPPTLPIVAFIETSLLPSSKRSELPFLWEVIDNKVLFVNENIEGIVLNIVSVMQGAIIVVEIDQKEVLVPYRHEFIQKPASPLGPYCLEIKAPEGLLDLYLNPDIQKADDG